jgi:peptidyl-prolyl cis-trans isomerase A (cyclophilin A)
VKRISKIIMALCLLTFAGPTNAQEESTDPLLKGLEPGLYAKLDTTYGAMIWKLHYTKTPSAVHNFVSLSQGKRSWIDPKTKSSKKSLFYDGLIFHRVAPGMLVQSGCPTGGGDDGPGYTFAREIQPDLRHDAAGVVSMLAAPKGTSHGSQFFITLNPAPKLNGLYAVFGKVVRGKDVLEDIGAVDIDATQKPTRPVRIKTVTIHPIGQAAKSWDPIKDARKEVPKATGKADPTRNWSKTATKVSQLNVQLLVIRYKGLPGASLVCTYTKEEAKQVALQIVKYARQKGADFTELEQKFSDEGMNGRTLQLRKSSPKLAKMFQAGFCLKTGQVSDPLDLPLGWCILYRPKVVMARHILISWKGGLLPGVTRSKEEARLIADDVRRKLMAHTDFGDLLSSYHDPLRQKQPARGRSNGSSAHFAQHEFAPIGKTAFQLKHMEVSEVLESPGGYYIVQRIQPISVRHILISWRGNRRVPRVKRSRADAQTLAGEIHKKLRLGESFESLLRQSDDKISPGGQYTDIAPEYMVKEFSAVAFKLKINQISGVVETPFGYHIIQRTK